MPATVNIERHKLNQAMYQKLKRYIMSKRKRELEEKAQDDRSKKLCREREERKRQAELDAANLEKTRAELASTRNKIQELSTKHNECFHRWKQLGIEESNFKEKQKQESLTLLANMPTTQFGLGSSALGGDSSRPAPLPNVQPRSVQAPGQVTPHSLPQAGKSFVSNMVPDVTLSHTKQQQQQQPHSQFPNPISSQSGDLSSAHHRTAIPPPSPSQKNPLPPTVTALPPGFGQLTNPALSTSPTVAITAVAAALAAQQQRSASVSDQTYSSTAAATAYLNAIASLTSTAQNPLAIFGGANPLALLNATNPASLAEVVANLAASGICALPTTSAVASNNNNIMVSTPNLNVFGGGGHRDSATAISLTDSSFPGSCSSQSAAALAAAFLQQQQSTTGLTKGYANNNHSSGGGRHSNSAAASVSGASLPPAPVSYRGSITTGQSAQQIQLQQQQQQQQAHQKHQHQQQQQLLSKYSDLASTRNVQQMDGSAQHAARSAMSIGRFSDAAALMASIGVTSPNAAAAMFNSSSVLQSGLPSGTAPTSNTTLAPASSPIALTAVLAPYAAELKQLNLLASATLQQQQQQLHQKQQNNSAHCSPSLRPRASPATSSNTPGSHPSSATSGRHFF